MHNQTHGHRRLIRVGSGVRIGCLGTCRHVVHVVLTDLSFTFVPFHVSISVNLGGLFVLEPFISPALFQKYPAAVDEWTLSQLMAADTANGGLSQLEDHYKTFIVSEGCFVLNCPINSDTLIDGTRYCGNRRGWIELGQGSHSLLGD